MKEPGRLDGFLAFLAGAASGAALLQWLAASGWIFPGDPTRRVELEARTRNATAASVRRIHTVLGEIRSLMKLRKTAYPQEGAAGSAAAAMESAAAAAVEASRVTNPEAPPRTEEAWRAADRSGYLRPELPAGRPEAETLAAAAAMSAGAAAAWAALHGNGSRRAWPAALGGFLAAAALVLLGRASLAGRKGWPRSSAPAGFRPRRSRSAAS